MTEHEVNILLEASMHKKELENEKELIKSFHKKGKKIELNSINNSAVIIEYEVVEYNKKVITSRMISKDYNECSRLFDKLMNSGEIV